MRKATFIIFHALLWAAVTAYQADVVATIFNEWYSFSFLDQILEGPANYKNLNSLQQVQVYYANCNEPGFFKASTLRECVALVTLSPMVGTDSYHKFGATLNFDRVSKRNFRSLRMQVVFTSTNDFIILISNPARLSVFSYIVDFKQEYTIVKFNGKGFRLNSILTDQMRGTLSHPPTAILGQTQKQLKVSPWRIMNANSGFFLVNGQDDLFKNFRVSFLPTGLQLSLFPKNPMFHLQSNYNPQRNEIEFTVLHAGPDIFKFRCPGKASLEFFHIRRKYAGEATSVGICRVGLESKQCDISQEHILPPPEDDEVQNELDKFSLDVKFKDNRAEFLIDERQYADRVFFKFQTKGGSFTLTFRSLDDRGNIISKTFTLPVEGAQRVQMVFIDPTLFKSESLTLSRIIRIDGNLFVQEDFCQAISGKEYVDYNGIYLRGDTEFFDSGLIRFGQIKTEYLQFLDVKPIYQPGLGLVKLVFYHKKMGMMISWVNSDFEYRFSTTSTALSDLVSVKTLPGPYYPHEMKEFFKLDIARLPGDLSQPPVVLQHLEVMPGHYFVKMDEELWGILNSKPMATLAHFDKSDIRILFYSGSNVIEIGIEKEIFSLKHRSHEIKISRSEWGQEPEIRAAFSTSEGVCLPLKAIYANVERNKPLGIPGNKILVDAQSKSIRLDLTQTAEIMKGKFRLFFFQNRHGRRIDSHDFDTFVINDQNTSCAFGQKSSLRVAVKMQSIDIKDSTTQRTFRVPVKGWQNFSSLLSLDLKRAAPTKLLCKAHNTEDREDNQCVEFGSFIIDSEGKYETFLFSKDFHALNHPLFQVTKTDSHLSLDWAYTPGLIGVLITNSKVRIFSDDLRLDFLTEIYQTRKTLSRPKTPTFYQTVTLHLYVNDVEEIMSVLTFDHKAPFSSQTIDSEKLSLNFKVSGNVDGAFLQRIAATVTKANTKFVVDFFENDELNLHLVVYNVGPFGLFELDQGVISNTVVNEGYLLEDSGLSRRDSFLSDSGIGRPQAICSVPEPQIQADKNRLCNEQRCFKVAIFPLFAPRRFYMVAQTKDRWERDARSERWELSRVRDDVMFSTLAVKVENRQEGTSYLI